MSENVTVYDCTPICGKPYREVVASGFKGVLVPYIAFDADIQADLRAARRRSIQSGILPMALVEQRAPEAMPSPLVTHVTPESRKLDAITDLEQIGLLPSGTAWQATHDLPEAGVISLKDYGSTQIPPRFEQED